MRSFWDERFDTDKFVYGKQPNQFFASSIKELKPGRVLMPGEGEGRNSVYAASLGWQVDAFDQSQVAVDKARSFMQAEGVNVNYLACGLEDFNFEKEAYDAVGLVFFHAHPEMRRLLHSRVEETLKPGGVVIMEAFHTSQLGNSTGGPQSLSMLFNENTLREDFPSLQVDLLEELTVVLDEGPFHQGQANIIRFIGTKN
jgi:2-polyprenyl-3-methyl-5-hydroxy-6-metoxy-1,4-benzoquinol methylase